MRKLFTVIGICVALAGCGASSTNTPVTETLASFPNGAGVFRKDMVDPSAGSQGNATKVLAYVPDLSKWVNDFSYSDVTSIVNYNVPLLQNNALGSGVDYYYDASGNVTILGENYNFVVLKVASSPVYLTGGYDSNSQLVGVVFGPKPTNLPSGIFSYTGYHGITTNLTNWIISGLVLQQRKDTGLGRADELTTVSASGKINYSVCAI